MIHIVVKVLINSKINALNLNYIWYNETEYIALEYKIKYDTCQIYKLQDIKTECDKSHIIIMAFTSLCHKVSQLYCINYSLLQIFKMFVASS